jgi:hypothetical protein
MDEYDNLLESSEEYAARVKAVVPNMPDDVIDQWFYSHPTAIDSWTWLRLSSVWFTLEEWATADVPALDREDGSVHTYRYHLDRTGPSPRMSRLIDYFAENQTWPRCPIMLENFGGQHVRPDGWKCRVPYQLLEGHHRLAVFSLYRDRGELAERHRIWVGRQSARDEAV